MRLVLLSLVTLALLPAAAAAGGWATVDLSSTPQGTPPGGTWGVDITVLQHGRTPLEKVTPAVVLRNPRGDETRFTGTPTGKPGVYRAEVEFPAAGRFTYTVDDGFTNAVPHTFPPVEIRAQAAPASAPARPGDDGGLPAWPFLAAGAAAVLAAALVGLRRRDAQPV